MTTPNSTVRSDSDLKGGETSDPDTLIARLTEAARKSLLIPSSDTKALEAAVTDLSTLALVAAKRIEVVEAAQLNLVRRATHYTNGGIDRALACIEELSKRPSTQWGEIVTAIRALKTEISA